MEVIELDVTSGSQSERDMTPEELAALPASPSFSELRAAYFAAEVRPKREIVLNRLGDIASRLDRAGQRDVALQCDAAAQALLDITRDAAILGPTDMDSLKAVVLNYYWTVALSLPESVRSAFNGVDE